MTDKIAIVGAGLIGRAWAIVFARAGRQVALYDPDPSVLPAARETIGANLGDLAESGLIADPAGTIQRIELVKDLEAALRGALYVQENGPENLASRPCSASSIASPIPAPCWRARPRRCAPRFSPRT